MNKKAKKEDSGTVGEAVPEPGKLKRKAYEQELAKLHVELVKLQE